MRAMPSPTSSTRPPSRACRPVRVPSISALRTETISSTRNAMTAPLDELGADVVQAGADAGVVDPIAVPRHHPPDQVRVDALLQDWIDLVADHADVLAQAPALVVGQRHRRGDLDDDPPGPLVVQPAVRLDLGADHVQAVVVVEDLQEMHEDV